MFSFVQTIRYYLAGEFSDSPYLRSYFWVYIALYLMSLGGIAYSATISYDFWLYNSGVDTNPETGERIALTITIAVAVLAMVLVAAVMGTVSNLVEKSKLTTLFKKRMITDEQKYRLQELSGSTVLDWTVVVVMLVIVVVDCYANYTGAAPFAERLTAMYSENQSDHVHAKYTPLLQSLDKQEAGILNEYSWCATHNTRHKVGSKCQDNKVIFAAKPQYGISKAKFLSDQEQLEKIRAERTTLQSAYNQALSNAETDYARGVAKYEHKIRTRTEAHRYFVFIIYALVFLATYQNSRYIELSNYHVQLAYQDDDEEEEEEDWTAKVSQRVPSTLPKKGKRKRGFSEATRKNIIEIYQEIRKETGNIPTNAEIAARTGKSERTVQEYMKNHIDRSALAV